MIKDVLAYASMELRNYLTNPSFKAFYNIAHRTRIEALIVEMDAICALPDIDRLPEGTLEAREEAMDQWHRERSRLREDEEAEHEAEAKKHVKPKPDDRGQGEELDTELWPD
ncbi:MAG: hypothetical protein LAO19_19345 [Acidobacteriia bacterium]|nr:hypothetical protein [Terriglobia bacterium]